MNATAEPQRATRREWLGLAIIALPCLLDSMDLTVSQYLQFVLALSPMAAGLATLPWALGFVTGSLAVRASCGTAAPRWWSARASCSPLVDSC